MRITNLPILAILLTTLTACSGDGVNDLEPTDVGGNVDDQQDVSDVFDDGSVSPYAYVPLVTLEKYKEWSGFTQDDVFRSYFKDPYIKHYVINPVNAATLAPVTTATMSDYVILEDGQPLEPTVNFPMLQKVLGNPVHLQTAIIINTSEATSATEANKAKLIDEIKAYVAQAKASDNSAIANQVFTVWGFDGSTFNGDGGIVDETNGFQTLKASIDAALDSVSANWGNYGSRNNATYDAITEAIGRFQAKTDTAIDVDFRDGGRDYGGNDLVEYITPDFMDVSNIVLFSSGVSAPNIFSGEQVIKALQSQAVITFDSSATPAGTTTDTLTLGKPLIYVVLDGGEADPLLENYAFATIQSSYDTGTTEYSFAESIIAAQQSAVDTRLYLSNQHVVRYASSIRWGESHTTEFKTKTADDAYGYALTAEYTRFSAAAMPSPSVEITGANNEYLAAGRDNAVDINNATNPPTVSITDYDSANAFYDQIQTFYPATRWTNAEYATSDYSWVSSGQITNNNDGSVTVDAGNTFPITITLTNNVISDSFTVTVYESY